MVVLSCVKKNLRQILIVLSSQVCKGDHLCTLLQQKHNVSMKFNNLNLKNMPNKLLKMQKQWKKSLKKKGSDWLLEEQITTYYLLMLKQVVVLLVKKHNVYLMKSILQLIKMQFLLIQKNHSKHERSLKHKRALKNQRILRYKRISKYQRTTKYKKF